MKTVPNTTYDMTGKEITELVVLKSGVIWKGGKFTGTGAAFTSEGSCIGASILNVELAPSMSTLVSGDVKPFIVYNGTDDNTFLYKDLLIDGVKISGKTTLFNGTFEGPKTFHDVVFGLAIKNVERIYDANSENMLVSGQSIYKFRAENWKLIGDTKTGLVDNGIVQLNSGNGQLKNIYRKGKQCGYIFRCWIVALKNSTDQDVKVENCVDGDTITYGTLDVRIDPGILQAVAAIPLVASNVFFSNNTSANKKDINGSYITNAVVYGQMADDFGFIWPISIQRNVAFGAQVSGMASGSSLVKDNSSGKSKIYLLDNSDTPPGQPAPAGIVDADYYGLTPIGAQRAVPVPPVPIKQRSVVYPTFDGKTNTWHYYYDDGSVQ